jgi:hypothetical protein
MEATVVTGRAKRVFRRRTIHTVINAVALSALLSVATTATVIAESPTVELDLSAMAIDGSMDEFTFARTGRGDPGKWELITEPSAHLGLAIAQTSQDRTDYLFPLAIYRPLSIRNARVSVRFMPVAGSVDQAGGIALRVAGPDDYYLARANALEDNVRFYRVVKGDRRQIAGTNLKVSSGEWHTLTIVAENDRFTVGFDGNDLFTTRDGTFADPGKIALWTKADSVTYFDQIKITPLP